MIAPVGAESMEEAVKIGVETYHRESVTKAGSPLLWTDQSKPLSSSFKPQKRPNTLAV